MIAVARGDNRTVCTFGDMMRVPGSSGTLLAARAEGMDVRVVYGPMDALELAAAQPGREIIFLGIGFETTLPVLGAALMEAEKRGLANFSMRVSAKRVEPVLRHLLELKEVQLDGFLLPGHVAMVTGSQAFSFLADEYGLPGVISGFESLEMAGGIHRLLELAAEGKAAIHNDYASVVTTSGNPAALAVMDRYFQPCEALWRGIGPIADSGMSIRPEFARLDAAERFPVPLAPAPKPTGCRCGDVIRGLIPPSRCGLFGRSCTPYQPVGPCMVSAEGACAAEYAYSREG
jgi:hydrogenase expression/formation protein HypD